MISFVLFFKGLLKKILIPWVQSTNMSHTSWGTPPARPLVDSSSQILLHVLLAQQHVSYSTPQFLLHWSFPSLCTIASVCARMGVKIQVFTISLIIPRGRSVFLFCVFHKSGYFQLPPYNLTHSLVWLSVVALETQWYTWVHFLDE